MYTRQLSNQVLLEGSEYRRGCSRTTSQPCTGRKFSQMHALCRNDFAYQKEWMDAHMDDAEKRLGKPVLLEEFGKRLIKGKDNELFEKAIDQLRNPVFQTTYRVVVDAIQS